MTLFILYWQVENDTVSAKEYGLGVLIFSVVVFVLFFLASGFGNTLFARSISDPLGKILTAVEQVKKGNYNTQVKVVSNDEIGILGDATNQMIRGLQEKEMLREVFGRYVTPQIRDEVISGRIPLDGEYKEVTVLFADLKDFTAMTETRDPKQMVQILNAYFQEMDTAIKARSGLILQFLGDEIYAVFGAPVPCLNHAEQAFLTALEMTQGLVRLNKRFASQGWPVLSHGIGIHTGKAVAASIGSPDRLSYLLVGDTINLASRLQSLTRSLDARIIISADTVDCLPPHLIQENLLKHSQSVQVKGRKVKIDIYLIS
jgi:adenylate cyclase